MVTDRHYSSSFFSIENTGLHIQLDERFINWDERVAAVEDVLSNILLVSLASFDFFAMTVYKLRPTKYRLSHHAFHGFRFKILNKPLTGLWAQANKCHKLQHREKEFCSISIMP